MFNFRKYITGPALLVSLILSLSVSAQIIPKPEPDPPKGWQPMDLKQNGFYGISLKPAYLFLQGKKSKPVVIATIDSGVDTLQKDLKSILWTNTKEIPGNGIDDDHNGYVDDIHGWNFLGGPDGKADFNETTEEVREYNKLKGKYEAITDTNTVDKKQYAYWKRVKTTYDST